MIQVKLLGVKYVNCEKSISDLNLCHQIEIVETLTILKWKMMFSVSDTGILRKLPSSFHHCTTTSHRHFNPSSMQDDQDVSHMNLV